MPVARKKPAHPRAGKTLKGPKKKATNVMLREDLLAKARELRLNLSAVLEDAVIKTIREADQAKWLDENKAAIESYNAWVAKRGVFSDGLRRF
jgi:antitoxin CcdA